ncbi:hypothetical protein [Dyella choica]|uniref:Uncharacterized protein n=1 Tax=Dyella choica TaxID=1927959 RepID=A0A432M1N0_9GAMM|nr:hypothetical protein [Dyella choica]RUL71438.1 hypothetical protein EKH80_18805 [Dyella choica]
MARTWTRGLTAVLVWAFMPFCMAYAQSVPQAGSSEGSSYLTQHFSFESLNPEVRAAITDANLAPVPFAKITLRTRDSVSSADQAKPSTYTTAITLENAGHGLVRRVEAVQDNNGGTIGTRLDLTYRGYFSFLTQGISPQAKSIPPVQEARKVLRLDTGTHGHLAFVYLYGSTGAPTSQDPGQFLCDSGKSYSASQLHPSIEGLALELNCRVIDSNGIETDNVTLAYLDNYAVAVTVRTHTAQRTVDSSIVDFNVR